MSSWGNTCHPTGKTPLVVSAAPAHRNVQGIRAHWSSENTAMHSVRSYNGLIFIEEHDLVSF
jgi:hypothetical protein